MSPFLAESRRDAATLVPLHEVDRALAAALAAGDPRASARFAERMICVPRYVATHLASGDKPADEAEVRRLAEATLVAFLGELSRYRGDVTLEGAAGRVAMRVLGARVAGLATTAALDRIAPGEARILRARHYEAIPPDGLALRLGLEEAEARQAYVSGLARLAVELGEGARTGTRSVLRPEDHDALDRWTTGQEVPDPQHLTHDPELAAAYAERRRLQKELDVAGAAERAWFQAAGRDPRGPQALAFVAELLARHAPAVVARKPRASWLVRGIVLVAIAGIVAVTVARCW